MMRMLVFGHWYVDLRVVTSVYVQKEEDGARVVDRKFQPETVRQHRVREIAERSSTSH